MRIILYQPQIPQNTGNIVRTCSVSNSKLTLIEPLGFSTSERMLKRAGLDYWDQADIEILPSLEELLKNHAGAFYFFSSKAKKNYTNVGYTPNDLLIFGSETRGLDPYFLKRWPEKFLHIPMSSHARCLNLSNAVAIVIYEALRQQDFLPLKQV